MGPDDLREASDAALVVAIGRFRPEALEVGTDGIPAIVEVVEELGADSYVFCLSELAGSEARLLSLALHVEAVTAARRPVSEVNPSLIRA